MQRELALMSEWSARREADSGVIKGAETIDMQEEGSRGVLLLHGFGDTPQTLSLLARRLHKAGYSVLAPLLPGHGRSLREFTKSSADEWIEAATERSRRVTQRSDGSVVGLSMGGALAVVLAATTDYNGAGSDRAVSGMPLLLRLAAATHWLWGGWRGSKRQESPSIHDPIEREKNLAYGAVTGSGFPSCEGGATRAKGASAVTAPDVDRAVTGRSSHFSSGRAVRPRETGRQ